MPWPWANRDRAYAHDNVYQARGRTETAVVFNESYLKLTYNRTPFENVDLVKSFRKHDFTVETKARFNLKQHTLAYAASLQVSVQPATSPCLGCLLPSTSKPCTGVAQGRHPCTCADQDAGWRLQPEPETYRPVCCVEVGFQSWLFVLGTSSHPWYHSLDERATCAQQRAKRSPSGCISRS